MDALTPSTIPSYLIRNGIAAAGEPLRITHIPSNVNHVFRVDTATRGLILKQARDQLVRFPDVPINPQRTAIEHNAIRRHAAIAQQHGMGESVPQVLHYDDPNRIIVFAAAPAAAVQLTRHLLCGQIDVAIAQRLGHLLATLHNATANDPEVAQQFANNNALMEVKLRFFHTPMRAAAKHSAAQAALDALIDRTGTTRIALVHGDTNPKNILIDGSTPLLIDYEFAHYGDPAFDLGCLLAHYYLCALLNPNIREQYFNAMRTVWGTYLEQSRLPRIAEREGDMVQHFAPFLWGRTFGRANIPNLPEPTRNILGEIADEILTRPITSLAGCFALADAQAAALARTPQLNREAILREVTF